MSNETINILKILKQNADTDQSLTDVIAKVNQKQYSPMEINKFSKTLLKEYRKESGEYIDYFTTYESLVQKLYRGKKGVCMDDIVIAEAESILITLSKTKIPKKITTQS